MKIIKFFVLISFFIILSVSAFAQTGFYSTKLDNGLDVFIMENDAAPVVYIEIAVKAGAIAQTKETAGLFHLYEHIMFKGNSKYKTAEKVQRALNDFGVSNWNGSTADEYVNYFFTIPSSLLKEGLEFWSYAIREPLLKSKELENEKKVVISEISGSFADPNKQYSSAIHNSLFSKYPWQLDPAGTVENVKNCTVKDLKNIKKTFYVPNNSALFIGGDVKAEEAMKLVKKIYGSWRRNDNIPTYQKHPTVPFNKPKYLVQPLANLTPRVAQISIIFRGPDTDDDVESTYPADVWAALIQNPSGNFTKNLLATSELEIPSAEYLSNWYYTKKSSGRIFFSATMFEPEKNIANRTELFYKTIVEKEIPKMISDEKYFTNEEFKKIKQQISDERLITSESASSFLENIRFWWASAPENYFFEYEKNLKRTNRDDICSFLEKYILNNQPIISVRVNPDVFEKQKDSFAELGFEVINAENAYYWNQPENNETQSEENIVETLSLKNGIPVYYLKNDKNRVLNLRILVEGGVSLIQEEKAGVEDALFSMFSLGSKSYTYEQIQTMFHEKSASMSGYSRKDFSQFQLNCLDYYFDDLYPVFIDGFLSPSFKQQEFEKLVTNYRQKIQQRKNDPEELLDYTMSKSVYEGHPYSRSTIPDELSIDKLTINDLKEHHAEILNANRIFVVAVGNFDKDVLLTKLNTSLGNLDKKPFVEPIIPKFEIKQVRITEKSAAAENTAFFARTMNFPNMTDDDYEATCIAARMFDEFLFNIVREKYGICYSIGNGSTGAKAMYGMIYASRISDLTNLEPKINEAIQEFSELSIKEINKRLPGFKNSYINSVFSSTVTNSGLGSLITTSKLIKGSPSAYTQTIKKINAVTALDIQSAFTKYWINSPNGFYTVTGN